MRKTHLRRGVCDIEIVYFLHREVGPGESERGPLYQTPRLVPDLKVRMNWENRLMEIRQVSDVLIYTIGIDVVY